MRWSCSSASPTAWSCSTSRCPAAGGSSFPAIRAIDHGMPVVMVTKSEETETLKDAIGAEISDYLDQAGESRGRSSPWSPGCWTATASASSGSPATSPPGSASWRRGGAARWPGASGSSWWPSWPSGRCGWGRPTSRGCRTRCARCRRACGRISPGTSSATTPAGCTTATATVRRSRWTSAPSSCGRCWTRTGKALLVVVDCLRLDQWAMIRPLISARFDIETAHYFSILPTATPFARNAIFSGLFPAEIKARYPQWWTDQRGGQPQRARGRAADRAAQGADRPAGAGALREGLHRRRRRGAARAGCRRTWRRTA